MWPDVEDLWTSFYSHRKSQERFFLCSEDKSSAVCGHLYMCTINMSPTCQHVPSGMTWHLSWWQFVLHQSPACSRDRVHLQEFYTNTKFMERRRKRDRWCSTENYIKRKLSVVYQEKSIRNKSWSILTQKESLCSKLSLLCRIKGLLTARSRTDWSKTWSDTTDTRQSSYHINPSLFASRSLTSPTHAHTQSRTHNAEPIAELQPPTSKQPVFDSRTSADVNEFVLWVCRSESEKKRLLYRQKLPFRCFQVLHFTLFI